jgi:hypothetical protein
MVLFDTSSHRDFSCREMRQIFIYHNRLFINGLWLNPVFCTDATQRPKKKYCENFEVDSPTVSGGFLRLHILSSLQDVGC